MITPSPITGQGVIFIPNKTYMETDLDKLLPRKGKVNFNMDKLIEISKDIRQLREKEKQYAKEIEQA